MTKVSITAGVHCSGSGIRLWPLLRKSFPTKFAPLVGQKCLIQLERAAPAGSGGTSAPEAICVAAEEQRFPVSAAMQAAKVKWQVILVLVAHNASAAMAQAVVAAEPTHSMGSETFLLTENHATHIYSGEPASWKTPGRSNLEMIEVQSDSYFGKDDIVRFKDNYGRA